jgi:hypothetical protein
MFWLLFFTGINYASSLTNKWVGLHFGRSPTHLVTLIGSSSTTSFVFSECQQKYLFPSIDIFQGGDTSQAG